MRLVASKHLNHGKNSEQLGTKSKVYQGEKGKFLHKSVLIKNKNDTWKVIHRILSPNPKTLKVDLSQSKNTESGP